MPVDQHISIWAWVFEWIHPSWHNNKFVWDYLQCFFLAVHYDEVYTTLGNLGQIIWDIELPLAGIFLAASYVCLDLIELIQHVYDVYQNQD